VDGSDKLGAYFDILLFMLIRKKLKDLYLRTSSQGPSPDEALIVETDVPWAVARSSMLWRHSSSMAGGQRGNDSSSPHLFFLLRWRWSCVFSIFFTFLRAFSPYTDSTIYFIFR
jgi:hypothetical protein